MLRNLRLCLIFSTCFVSKFEEGVRVSAEFGFLFMTISDKNTNSMAENYGLCLMQNQFQGCKILFFFSLPFSNKFIEFSWIFFLRILTLNYVENFFRFFESIFNYNEDQKFHLKRVKLISSISSLSSSFAVCLGLLQISAMKILPARKNRMNRIHELERWERICFFIKTGYFQFDFSRDIGVEIERKPSLSVHSQKISYPVLWLISEWSILAGKAIFSHQCAVRIKPITIQFS